MARVRHINVQVPQDLYDEVRSSIPRGLRMVLFESILTLIMQALRADGPIVLGAIMSGEYKLTLARKEGSKID